MLLTLNFQSHTPLYIQVYEELKKKIMSQDLVTNQKLPSKRVMSEENGISQNTVLNAYDQLLVEGYIYSEERRGYFVENIDFQADQLQPRATSSDLVYDEEQAEKNLIDLTRSNADSDLFPGQHFVRIYSDLMGERNPNLLKATEAGGLYRLRFMIASYLNQSRGVPCQPGQLVLGPNSQYLLDLLFKFIHPHIIGMEDPGYDGYRHFFDTIGLDQEALAVEEDGLSIEALRQASADIIFITPNHQFPTGSIMPLDKRQQVLDWAGKKEDRYIIEDDYDSEFKYSGIPVPPLSQLDHGERVIYLSSFTRNLSPGIRLSYMVLPPTLAEKFYHYSQGLSAPLSTTSQYVLAQFMEEGSFTRHLNRSRRHYKKKRDAIIQAIEERDPQATVLGEEAGLSLLVRPSVSFDGHKLKAQALTQGIRLALLSDFAQEIQAGQDQILFISFSSIDMSAIEETVGSLWKFIQD